MPKLVSAPKSKEGQLRMQEKIEAARTDCTAIVNYVLQGTMMANDK